MANDWPAALKTQQVTATTSAASATLLSTTREVIIVNLSEESAYVNVNGEASAASGSLFVPGTLGFERVIPVGSGMTISYVQDSGEATLELTEVG